MKRILRLRTLWAGLIFAGLLFWTTGANSQAPFQEASERSEATGSLAAPLTPSATLFNYQGQLLDSAGHPITDAAMPMTFRLYGVASGGTPCWSESRNGANGVDVQDGLFHVLLGQLTAIPASCLSDDAYLELAVNGQALTPRELLGSVAFAVEASTLPANATTLGDLTIAGDARVTSRLKYTRAEADGGTFAVLGIDAGATKNFELFDYYNGRPMLQVLGENRDVQIFGNTSMAGGLAVNGNAGIGTTTPQSKLHVNGTSWFQGNTTPLPATAGQGIAIGFADGDPVGYIFGFDYGASAPRNIALQSPGGNVGIGTINPSEKLDVAGAINLNNSCVVF